MIKSTDILSVTKLAANSADKSSYYLIRRIILISLLLLIPLHSIYSQWLTGFQHRKAITINASQIIGGPHTDFAVLVSTTDPDLRTQGNGGYLLNSNAWDIAFSVDNVSILDHQVESYNPATGQIVAWVRIPALTGGSNFVFYIYFGNAGISSDPSTSSTWSSDYNGVWHLSGLQDASNNGNNASDNGTINTTGIIDGARDIPGGGQNFEIDQSTINNGDFTISTWFRPDNVNDGTIFDLSNIAGIGKFFFTSFDASMLSWYFEAENELDSKTDYYTTLNPSKWYYLTTIGRFNGDSQELYLNGNLVGTSNIVMDSKPALINNIRVGSDYGYYPIINHGPFDGQIDEFRISNVVRTPDWIMTEYKNQYSPSSFMTFGSLEDGVPSIFNVTGSGSFCSGSAGRPVQLSGSQAGVQYQLRINGNDAGSAISGTGGSLNWIGTETGLYTVVATNVSSGLSAAMTGSATMTENVSAAAALGYNFQKTITIDHTKVTGGINLTDFPVLINIAGGSAESNELRTVANGGNVQNINGYDILFTDANYNKLEHQIERYDPVSGNLVAWVRVPVLSASSNTEILMLYGNPQIISNPSLATVWSSTFRGVWHLDGTDFTDASQYTNDGTNSGTIDIVGQIGNGKKFNGSTDFINAGKDPSLFIKSAITVSAWVYANNPTNGHIINMGGGWTDPGYSLFWYNGNIRVELQPVKTLNDVPAPSFGSWHHVAFTWDINTKQIQTYIDGIASGAAVSYDGPLGEPLQNLLIGKDETQPGFVFNGIIDEARVQSIARSAGWINTEYNNQKSASSFYSIGSQSPCSVSSFSNLCSGSPVTYSVPNTAGHTYTWTVIGGSPTATSGNTINVTWNASGPYSIQLSESNGTCTGNSLTYSVVVAAPPNGPSLNAKTPNLPTVCDGQTVSATFTAGSGGVGCTDAYQYRFDSGTWNSYTPGAILNTAGHILVEIQGQRAGCTGTGCSGTAWVTLASWTINPQPVGPAINTKTPGLPTVCDGQTVSATFTPGSGGFGCGDVFQYRYDSGIWNTYTPGSNLSTTGHILVEIQGQRAGCTSGAGCIGTAWVPLASWTVNPQPVGPTLNAKSPALASVCDGQTVSATFTAGSGGVGCSDGFQYRFDSGSWNSYTPGNNLSTSGHILIEIQGQRAGCTAGTGCTGTAWVTLASWTVNQQPVGPTLNAKTPNIPTVCDGQVVSATFAPGSGGTGCADAYQYRFDSGMWNSYTPGTNLTTAGHTLVEIQGQRAGCTAGAGCTGTAWVTLASWTVNPQPVGPTLNAKTPALASVCDGQTVSATFTAGSGGVGCSDAFQYRFDSGTWNSYNPGTNLNTTGHTLVEIQGQRAGCTAGTGCTGTTWITLASWTINPQPVGPALNVKTPNLPAVCDGQTVSATFTPGSGGAGCADAFEFRFDSGTWNSYTPGTNLNTAGHTLVEIQGQRTGCSAGAGCSGTEWVTLTSWNVNPQPVGPTLDAKSPALAAVCDGQTVSATFIAGSGGVGCSDAFQYRFDSGTWNSYTPGTNLSTTGHILVEIQGQRAGCTAGAGCAGTAWVNLASWTVNLQPVGPTLNAKTPNLPTICDGQIVSATFTAGSGGTGCADAYEYRFDSGTWNSYTPGTNLNTAGHTLVEIQGQRAGCIAGTGCAGTAWVTLASWIVNPQPVAPTLNTKTPNLTTTCEGQTVAATFTAGSGGVGCSDAFRYRFDSGTWNSYTPGTNLNTTGHILVEIQGQRAGCTAGCTGTAWSDLASWTVNPNPAPVITGTANVCPGSSGVIYSTPLVSGNIYTWTISGASSYSGENTNILTVNWPAACGSGSVKVTETIAGSGCSTSTADFTVSRTDLIAPTWSTISGSLNRTVQCNDALGLSAAQALFPAASDNCDADVSDIVKVSGGFVAGSCSQAGTYINTWTVTDACGNTSPVFSQLITIVDNQKPVWTTAANLLDRTVQCSDAAALSAAQILQPSATDNCDTNLSNLIKVSGIFVPGANPREGTYTNTWTVTDDCGNVSDAYTQIITIIDNTPPTIVCPPDITISCEANNTPAATGVATGSDNCSPQAGITIGYSDASTYNSDPTSILHYNYTIARKWRATDEAGNYSECTQTITVNDITKPVITCPADMIVNCHDDNSPAGTGIATATDNCTPVSNITITHSDLSSQSADPSNPLYYNYSIARTWRATDMAGNYSECLQKITIHDITNPVITCPADITINCEDDNTPAKTGTATASDNCTQGTNLNVTYSDISTQSADPSNPLHYDYTITRKWKATDVTGNFSECTQTITVQDVTNPEFTVPASITVCRASDCSYDAGIAVTGDVTDESDNCTPTNLLNAVYTDDLTGLPGCDNNGFILRTWTLTDIKGNSTVKVQTILVEPAPSVSITNNSPVICDGSNVNLVFNSPTLSIIPADLKYVVTVSSTDPAHLGGTASTGFTILKAGMPFTLAGSLTNSSNSPITVTYSVVPQLKGCSDGTVQTQNVIVNPTPQVIPDKLLETICNDGLTNILLASPSTFSSGTITFNFTATATGGVTGFSVSGTGKPKDYLIADVLHNPTDAPQTVTYTITPISPTGCAVGPVKTVIVTVDPTPQVFPGSLAETICNDAHVNVLLASPSTFSSGAISFSYTVTTTGGVTGFTTPVAGLPGDYLINDILHNTTDSPQTVTYTIVPVSPSGCNAGPSKVLIVTVNPTPQVSPNTLAQTICNDGITNIVLASQSIFTSGVITFDYTAVATGGVTGFSTGQTGKAKDFTIADILHNPTDSPQTVTYTIIPKSPTGCPAGPVKVVVITIDPTPKVVPDKLNQTVCNDSPISVTLGSPSIFDSGIITFKYTVTATGGVTGFTTPVSGLSKDHIISDILHNPTDIPQTVTYIIVPVSPDGCADGPSETVIITVNPTPQVIPSTLLQTICDGGTTNIILGSPSIFTSGVIKFSYTVTATGGVTGFTTPMSNLPKDYVISDVLQNPSDAPQTVTYTIVPVSPTGCPAGPSKIVVVTVNPTPQVVPSTLLQTICNDGLTNVTLGSSSTYLSGAITFNYTVVATGGVTGFSTPVTGLPKDFVIADLLHNPTDSYQTVTYTIVPVSPTGCSTGSAKIVVITVNPTPQVVPSRLSQTICNDGTTDVILGSPSVFSNGVIRFNYTVAATGGVTGFTTPVNGRPKDFVIADVLHNPTDASQTVTYTIVPVSPASCASGPVKIVVVTVNPSPRIFPIPANTLQCDSMTTNIRLQSPSLFSTGLITFNYSVSSTGSVSGFSTLVSGLPNNHIIADKLVNTSDHFQVVTYTIIPVSPSGCSNGTPRNVTVTVNPTPKAVPGNFFPSICYTGTANAPVTTEIILTSPTVMTSGAITFDYTVNTTGGGAIVGNTSPGVSRPLNYTISNSYQNNSDTIQSVYYRIIPRVDNAICVPGKTVISEVKVHARPIQNIIVTKQLTCSDGPGLGALKAIISKGANPYHIVWTGAFNYHMEDSLEISRLKGKYVLKVTDNLGCNAKDSVTLNPVYATPSIQTSIIPPGNYNLSCVGSTDGTILISVSSGITPPYAYTLLKNDVDVIASGVFTDNFNFANPLTFKYINNLGAGSYTLVIRDVNNCEARSNPLALRVPPPIVAPIKTTTFAGGFNISCKGYNDGSAWVIQPVTGGRGTYTYRWYTSDGVIPGAINTDRIDNLVAGTYYLEIKDFLGCSLIQSTVITEPDGMKLASYQLSKTPDGNFNVSCNGGNDGSISMTITGGSGNYIFTWTGPNGFSSTAKDLTGLKAGVYTCLIKDFNGCDLTPSPSFTLTEPTPLVINSATYSTSVDGAYNISCYGANTGWVHLSVSGGSIGAYTYNWSSTNGSGIIQGQKDQNALSAGNYRVVVTDLNNCTVIKDITLTQPPEFIIQLAPVNITCKSPGFNNGSINLTVSGGIGPYTYRWSNGAVTEDLINLTPGTYIVTVTDANGCIKTGTAAIELPPTLNYTKNLSDYNGFNISCNGMSNGYINVDPTTGSAPFVYSWTGPDGFTSTLKNISDIKAGQYSLLIIDNNECKASETFNLTEPQKLTINYDLSESKAGGFNLNCTGDNTGYITVNPVNEVKTVSYLWQDGIYGKTRTNLSAGNYNLIITDANNCHANAVITLTEPDSLKILFNIAPPFCPDKPDGKIETTVTGGVSAYSYNWSDNSTVRNLSDVAAGKYTLIVSDQNGCSAKESVTVDPINETCLIIPNAISPNGDLINDVWNIGMIELYPLMEVKIFNRWGQAIWRSEKGYPRPWDGKGNGSTLPIDSYHYIIDLHNGSKPLVGNVTIVR